MNIMDDFAKPMNIKPVSQVVATPVLTHLSTAVISQLLVQNVPVIPRSLPDAGTREGNLFKDRFDGNLRWYTPEYVLAPDPDDLFGFDASRSGADQDGNPFQTGLLTLGLIKVVPNDVQAFQAVNSNVQVKEIPVAFSTATLNITFRDSQTGILTPKPYTGVVTATNDGGLKLTFQENILGPSVINLYQNLIDGGAEVAISGTFDVWYRRPSIVSLHGRNVEWIPVDSAPMIKANLSLQRIRISPDSGPVFNSPPVIHPPFPLPPPPPTPDPPPEDQYLQGTSSWSITIGLGKKYAANAYSLKFTISDASSEGTTPRPIISIDDLKSFNLRQSEYKELTALGDVSQRYPSISRLYFGVLSKTIVAIPSRYSIARTINGPSSLCAALLDSGSSGISKCKFQFTFLIAPDVSPTEMAQLASDISVHPVFKNYNPIKFPDFLKEGSPKLATAYQSASYCSSSIEQHIFQLTIEIADEGTNTPAVANANLLIKQLCLSNQPFLTGTLSLKLDDYYPDPVETLVVLDFRETSGTDELTYSIDEVAQKINLYNRSLFELSLLRYALCTASGVTVIDLNQNVASGNSITVELPADHKDLKFVMIDRELAIDGAILKDNIRQFLSFITQDVQRTQYRLGVNASSVRFKDRGISKITVGMTLPDLSDVTVPDFSLVELQTVDGTTLLIPLENAITDLQATVSFSIYGNDPNQAKSKFTLEHDFIEEPILVLGDSDLDSANAL